MTDTLWWERHDLQYRDNRLFLGDQDLERLANASAKPTFAYRSARVLEKLADLHAALDGQGVAHEIFYAIKANRYAPLLTSLRLLGNCGIDVCSPRELLLARQIGFGEQNIVYTGTSVSNRDLDVITAHPDLQFNSDSLSTLRRLGERCPGREIGLRINPRYTASYYDHISYAGDKASKFGIYPDRFDEALSLAAEFGMKVTRLHFHAAAGYLTDDLPDIKLLLDRAAEFLDKAPEVRKLDIGGGLGVPLKQGDQPLDLDKWASLLAQFANPRGLTIQIEPGDFLVKDAGLLLTQVNTIEDKGGTRFVGVEAGFNLSNLHAYYGYPFVIAPLIRHASSPLQTVTIAGNINEGSDTLAEDIELPRLREGDRIALMNLGGYSVSNSSDHCMRGDFAEYLVVD